MTPSSKPSSTVLAVCKKSGPGIPKHEVDFLKLIEDFGVEGDYHSGKLVRHRYLAAKDATRPNHRQVLLVDLTIVEDLRKQGIDPQPGSLGENILVDGMGLMSLPVGTRLKIGTALVELTEVRDPCSQLNETHRDLLKAVVQKKDAEIQFNAGIFARVIAGGMVRPGDAVVLASKPSLS